MRILHHCTLLKSGSIRIHLASYQTSSKEPRVSPQVPYMVSVRWDFIIQTKLSKKYLFKKNKIKDSKKENLPPTFVALYLIKN